MKGVNVMGKAATPDKWSLRVLKSNRNEIRVHVCTSLITVFYKNNAGLRAGYQFAKRHLGRDVAISVMNDYKTLLMQGA